MEDEISHILERWHGRLIILSKSLEDDQARNQSRVLNDLADRYITQVFERNRKIVEVIRVKEDIESKI
jgi:hypothetical protein